MNRGKLNCARTGSREALRENQSWSGCPLVENHNERASLFRGDAIKIKNQTIWATPRGGKREISETICRIPDRPFDYMVKAGQPARPTPLQKEYPTEEGEIMAQYLVAIHHPDNYDPSVEGEAMQRDISALNEEMDAAGARIFAGGLSAARGAKSLRAQPDGKVLITDGPYLETKEHIGGFWILEAPDLDEALAWGRKAAVACRAPVEVRPFLRVRPNGSD
jgi:hypothetical protein